MMASSDFWDLRLLRRLSGFTLSGFVEASACCPVDSSGLREGRLRAVLSDSPLSGFSVCDSGSTVVSSCFKASSFSPGSFGIGSFLSLPVFSPCSLNMLLSAFFDGRPSGDSGDSVSLSGWLVSRLSVTSSWSFWDGDWPSSGFVSLSALSSSFLFSSVLVPSGFWDLRLFNGFSGFTSSDFLGTFICSSSLGTSVGSSSFIDERLRRRLSDLLWSGFSVSAFGSSSFSAFVKSFSASISIPMKCSSLGVTSPSALFFRCSMNRAVSVSSLGTSSSVLAV